MLTNQVHSERAHARISASSADRWINCPKSVALQELMPERGTSSFAEEGSLAHELAEQYLLTGSGIDGAILKSNIDDIEKRAVEKGFNVQEMHDNAKTYFDYVTEVYNQVKNEDPMAAMIIEQRLNMTEWIPGGFGTNDAVIAAMPTLHVFDYKYGKGVQVYAENNSQLKLYALAAYRENEMEYDGVTHLTLHIVQPRLDHIDSWTISLEELLEWGDTVVKEQAAKAEAGEGETKAGHWCKFCTAKARCKTASSYALEFVPEPIQHPDLMDPQEINGLLSRAKFISDFLENVKSYAISAMLDGTLELPDFKIVEGRSMRQWTDTDEVAKRLQEEYDDDQYLNIKLKGLGDIEKLVGKKNFQDKLGDLVTKPKGAPALDSINSKKPKYQVVTGDDFEI